MVIFFTIVKKMYSGVHYDDSDEESAPTPVYKKPCPFQMCSRDVPDKCPQCNGRLMNGFQFFDYGWCAQCELVVQLKKYENAGKRVWKGYKTYGVDDETGIVYETPQPSISFIIC